MLSGQHHESHSHHIIVHKQIMQVAVIFVQAGHASTNDHRIIITALRTEFNFRRNNPESSQALIAVCALTPYSREEFTHAYGHSEDPVERARRLVVRATMGFGSAGATKGKTGFRLDTRRNSATAQAIWARQPDNLAAVASRFTGVLVENRDAVTCMKDHDTPSTLHFVDPPYIHDTRVEVAKNSAYRFEMTDAEHITLLDCLRQLSGMVIVCGYDSKLYNDALSDWKCITRTTSANGRAGSVQRTECLWINPAAQKKETGPCTK